ncbi:hypothetical protein F1C16_05775 [Hymenobacter sp. NBH84]|uniref:hypothetical protein n=1 Tax=Hymenobacter sp. NBH84 TaxID=2596915 RepID=UPI00162538A5|nr:hypothetical protein [Hymenobacter sp. NBH84]QNE39093.1 hypothetical protein F1C16_05775 [Hymenobacter sp. NBH84]
MAAAGYGGLRRHSLFPIPPPGTSCGQRGHAAQAWLLLNRATLSNDELTRKLIRYSPDSVLSWFPRRRLLAQDGQVELYIVGLK